APPSAPRESRTGRRAAPNRNRVKGWVSSHASFPNHDHGSTPDRVGILSRANRVHNGLSKFAGERRSDRENVLIIPFRPVRGVLGCGGLGDAGKAWSQPEQAGQPVGPPTATAERTASRRQDGEAPIPPPGRRRPDSL